MKPKRRIFVLWYDSDSFGGGWPTMNTADEKLPNAFTSHIDANKGLKDHNKRWPEDKKDISIKTFEEVSR